MFHITYNRCLHKLKTRRFLVQRSIFGFVWAVKHLVHCLNETEREKRQ